MEVGGKLLGFSKLSLEWQGHDGRFHIKAYIFDLIQTPYIVCHA